MRSKPFSGFNFFRSTQSRIFKRQEKVSIESAEELYDHKENKTNSRFDIRSNLTKGVETLVS